MSIGRLGSWESEGQLHGLYRGQNLGQMNPGGNVGGGVLPLRMALREQGRGPWSDRASSLRAEYTDSQLTSSAGAANTRLPTRWPFWRRFWRRGRGRGLA